MTTSIPNQIAIAIEAPFDLQKRLIHFVTEYLNRGFSVRDAVGRGFKATADSYNDGREIRVSEEVFERTVASFEKQLEEYRKQQAAGAQAVGEGVYVEVVSEDEYRERTS
jgi:hypothetical protein